MHEEACSRLPDRYDAGGGLRERGAEGMTPGTYSAEANGFHGTIQIDVTVDAESITGIEIVEQSETAGIGEAALPVLGWKPCWKIRPSAWIPLPVRRSRRMPLKRR